MDCKAFNVGVNDLAYGKEYIKKLEQLAEYPFVSANILDATTKDTLFQRSVILETPDLTLGIVGVTNGDGRQKEFIFSDPVVAARKEVDRISSRVDMVILLANVNDLYETRLANEVAGVDFLIRSHTARVNRTPQKIENTVIIRNGNRGKYAGIHHISKPEEVGGMQDVSRQRSRIRFTENRLKSLAKEVPEGVSLEEFYQADSARLVLIQRLRNEQKNNLEAMTKLGNGFYFEALALDEKIADDPEIEPLVAAFVTPQPTPKR